MNDTRPPDPLGQLLPVDAPDDLRRLAAYWAAKAAGRTMPAFADIDAVEIPWALSRLYVVRVLEGGADFFYRLAGERVNERYHTSLAGKRPHELFPPALAQQILERWRRIVGEPAACYTVSEHPTNAGRWIRSRRLVVPLGPDGGPADHVLGMSIFEAPAIVFSASGDTGVTEARWVGLGGEGRG